MNHALQFAAVAALSLGMSCGVAQADTPQQTKMATCNADAKTQALTGEARKAFMKNCLSARPANANSQQNRMVTCNADAKTQQLAGDARKAFMKTCLSGATP